MEAPEVNLKPVLQKYCSRLLWCAAVALLCMTVAAADADDMFIRASHYVEVRDGTRLAMNIYRPAANGKVIDERMPVVFVFTPYRARYHDANGKLVQLSMVERFGMMRLLEHGYVIAEADVRGKGASFGARRGFQDRTEAYDGYDLVQWLAAQPWSSGAVGMVGCSYLGGTTVHVATTRPPALKAIFAGATDLDKFDFVRRGGITAQFNTRPDEPLSDDLMSVPMDEDADGSLLRAAVAQHAANTPMAALWYGMPYRDSVSELTGNRYWEEVGPYTYLDDLKDSGIATYFWSNLKDEPTSQVILAAANLGSKLLIGPGSHCVPPPEYDLGGEIERFLERHLKGVDNGIESEPRTTLWVENAPTGQHWKRSNDLPGAHATPVAFYLDGARSGTAPSVNDGSLSTAAGKAARQSFNVDYDLGEGEYFSFWVDPQDEHGLTYTGPALSRPLHLEGYPVVHLNISADRDDANVFAYLEEVDASGKPQVLAMGRLAAANRALSVAPYDTLGLPWHSGREGDRRPLVPGQPAKVDIALLPVSHIVPAGHRLRLTVTGADLRQRNLADIRQSPPPAITVHTGGSDASRMELPVLEN